MTARLQPFSTQEPSALIFSLDIAATVEPLVHVQTRSRHSGAPRFSPHLNRVNQLRIVIPEGNSLLD